jgi:hypothetical protein
MTDPSDPTKKIKKRPTSQRPINPEKVSLQENIKEWAFDYFAGFFQLKGDNPLVKAGVWSWMQKIASKEGKAILVKKIAKNSNYQTKVPNNLEADPEGTYLVASIKEIKYKPNALRTPESIKVEYLDREGQVIFDEDLLKPKFQNEWFLVMGNTFDWKPDLSKSELILNFMNYIYRSMIWDLEIYRPRLIIKTKFKLDTNIKRIIRQDFDKWNLITFASPDNAQPWDVDKWTPDTKFDKLRDMFKMNFNLFKELNNIRFNPSQKLEGRLPVKEVELNEDQFEGKEAVKQQERETFLTWIYKVDGGYDYQLWSEGKMVFKVGDRWSEEEKNKEGGESGQIEGDEGENKKNDQKNQKLKEKELNKEKPVKKLKGKKVGKTSEEVEK